ncbi:YbaB/EbfC family nucleoid-associated protein [Saccharothrix deserti]|uniref:YbaB/EbfC family nucleoid-associated protein n=1 Tax=Saccharothrix deserti TaxID=2593674 RepID=UPI00131E0911|nr:YbaB/EbfC family nucleoid-associated protein [Saccharothrix deserti]
MDTADDRLVEDLRAVHREITDVRAGGVSPDGLVTATVNGSGDLLALELNPRVYREHDTRALADRILSAVADANAEARRRVNVAVERLVPNGSR